MILYGKYRYMFIVCVVLFFFGVDGFSVFFLDEGLIETRDSYLNLLFCNIKVF